MVCISDVNMQSCKTDNLTLFTKNGQPFVMTIYNKLTFRNLKTSSQAMDAKITNLQLAILEKAVPDIKLVHRCPSHGRL